MAGENEARVRAGALIEQVGLPATKDRRLSARALGRTEAACDDRDGARLQPVDGDRGRADHRARRDGAGAGADPAPKQLQSDLGLAMLFITHDLSVLVEVVRPTRHHVRGQDRGGGPGEQRSSTTPCTRTRRRSRPRSRRSATSRFRGRPSGLGGDPPDPQHIPTGCPFHPRCRRGRGVSENGSCPSCGRPGEAGARRLCPRIGRALRSEGSRGMSDVDAERPRQLRASR